MLMYLKPTTPLKAMEWETERSIIFTRSSPRSLSLIHQPLSAGAKRVKEDWKSLFFYGFMGSMVFGTAVIYYKPNTKHVKSFPFFVR